MRTKNERWKKPRRKLTNKIAKYHHIENRLVFFVFEKLIQRQLNHGMHRTHPTSLSYVSIHYITLHAKEYTKENVYLFFLFGCRCCCSECVCVFYLFFISYAPLWGPCAFGDFSSHFSLDLKIFARLRYKTHTSNT